jgi:hypothetical protein
MVNASKLRQNNKGCCEWVSDSDPIRLRPMVEQARSDV